MKLLLGALVLGLAVAQSSESDLQRRLIPIIASYSTRARCDLVRAVFSPTAFDPLPLYIRNGCDACMLGGRVVVYADVVAYGAHGLGEGRPWVADGEHCESTDFVLLTDSLLARSDHPPSMAQLTLLPDGRNKFGFGVTIAVFPTATQFGSRGKGAVTGVAVRRRGKWTLRPDK
jgi:hypothetical protein